MRQVWVLLQDLGEIVLPPRQYDSNLTKAVKSMSKKKIFLSVLILIVAALCLNVFVQQKFINTYTYTELEYGHYDEAIELLKPLAEKNYRDSVQMLNHCMEQVAQ